MKATASKAYAERLTKLDPVPVEDIAERLPVVPSGADIVAETKHDILTALPSSCRSGNGRCSPRRRGRARRRSPTSCASTAEAVRGSCPRAARSSPSFWTASSERGRS